MNILMLNVSKGWAGTEAHSITLAQALIKKGNKVVVGCLDDAHVRVEAEKAGLETRFIKLKTSSDKFLAAFSIKKVASEMDADVIVSNCGNEVLPLALAGFMGSFKKIFFMHGMVRVSGLKKLLLSRYYDSTVAVSQVVEDYLINCGLPKDKVTVIHNGIDIEKFNPENTDRDGVRNELGIAQKDVLIGTAARLCPEKGIFQLINAFEQLADRYPVRLVISGDGPSRKELEDLADSKGLSGRVTFTGIRKDIERIYAGIDIFVHPAVWEEPFGLVVIEAMAMKKPVVATRAGGVKEIVEHEKDGILVPPGDIDAIANAVSGLIEDKDKAQAMALQGRQTVEEKFLSSVMACNLEKLIASL